MIEVEVKVPVRNKGQLEKQLLYWGFVKRDLLKETDYYFDSYDHCFRNNDKALRIRCCENMTRNIAECYMTYKGPKMDAVSMTRKELEMKIEHVDVGMEILRSLGYEPVLPVIKLRQQFSGHGMNACLDTVDDLGDFLELEMVIPDDGKKDEALEEIFKLLKMLGYEVNEIIRTSYLSMLQNKTVS